MKYEINNRFDVAFIQSEDFTFKTVKNRFGVTGDSYASATVEKCFGDDRLSVAIVDLDGEIISQNYVERKNGNVIYSLKDSLADIINGIDNENEIRI